MIIKITLLLICLVAIISGVVIRVKANDKDLKLMGTGVAMLFGNCTIGLLLFELIQRESGFCGFVAALLLIQMFCCSVYVKLKI